MPTTTNFGWTTPADTDYVKDGALAIRTLGNGIDTSLVDLKGGTTGQVLSKASNTDLDFSWVAQDDSNAIQNALLTTTGDVIYASAASTPARLAIGSTGNVLTVSGGVPVWAAPAGGGKVLQVVQGTSSTSTSTTSTSWADTTLSASITPSATNSKVLIMVSQFIRGSRGANTAGGGLRLLRDSTRVFGSDSASSPYQNFYYQAIGATDINIRLQFAMTYLDSPNTTSSTTYKTQFAIENGGQSETMTAQEASSTSSIILMEIGA